MRSAIVFSLYKLYEELKTVNLPISFPQLAAGILVSHVIEVSEPDNFGLLSYVFLFLVSFSHFILYQ